MGFNVKRPAYFAVGSPNLLATHAKGFIQSEMASHLKLKNTPSLTFYLDETKKKSNHILQLIEKAVTEDK